MKMGSWRNLGFHFLLRHTNPLSRFLGPLWFQWRWSSCKARHGSHWNLMRHLGRQHGNATSSGAESGWSQRALPWFGKFRLLWYTNSLDGGCEESSGRDNDGMMVEKCWKHDGGDEFSWFWYRNMSLQVQLILSVLFCQYFNVTPRNQTQALNGNGIKIPTFTIHSWIMKMKIFRCHSHF